MVKHIAIIDVIKHTDYRFEQTSTHTVMVNTVEFCLHVRVTKAVIPAPVILAVQFTCDTLRYAGVTLNFDPTWGIF